MPSGGVWGFQFVGVCSWFLSWCLVFCNDLGLEVWFLAAHKGLMFGLADVSRWVLRW